MIMTKKEELEKELKELKENCEQARESLKENFKEDSFELLQEILDNQTKYFVHNVRFGRTFEKNELCKFNRVCLYVSFQDNGTMYITLPISEEK
jgi:uncharacterized membrane-anchored protein YhcB (DUF1043 family)